MKICRIVKNFPPLIGGMEYHARDLSYTQAKKGHLVDIFIMRGSAQAGDERVRIKRVWGEVISHKLRDTLASLLFMSLVDFHLIIRRAKTNYDIFHLHGDIMEALFGALAGKIYKKPAVITIHAGLNTKGIYRRLAGRWFDLMDHIIAVSEAIASEMVQMGVDPMKISVIPSGIHYNNFAACEALVDKVKLRRNLGLPQEIPLIIGVGRLHPMKGFKYLINTVAEFDKTSRDLGVVIVGDGPERCELVKIAKRSKKKIVFAGRVEKNELHHYLLASDIFVLPSVSLEGQREGTPTAVMEAMAAGLPVVTTDVGGAKRLIKEGINGFLVPQKDSKAIWIAIEKLISQPSLMRAMGENNKKKARRFDWEQISHQVETVYKACLANKRRSL